ncbi:MAG: helix-turn-helix transcriptional regulator [Lachnospiraceae bacterium]|nr:helix-turn-helix transcriptional regulator [Lachnospiraceae bacterium]
MLYFVYLPCSRQNQQAKQRSRKAERRVFMDSLLPAIDILSKHFATRNWRYLKVPEESRTEKVFAWPGGKDEEIMICVHKGCDIHELFHRQDFFFFNFAYQGDYGALSYRYDNHITVHEGECYIGQPYAGYALSGHSKEEIIIVGVLIRKETFFRRFLSILATDTKMFHFFLEPSTNQYSDEFIQLKFDNEQPIRALLEMMIMEYAFPKEDTQDILKPMVLTLFMLVARQYKADSAKESKERLSDKIVRYMGEHTSVVTLKEIASHFSYHPNYISSLLHKELGRTFSELLLEQRMEKALILLKGTNLSVSEIAEMLGYSNSSNFYKAFRDFYGMSPREFFHL